MLWCRDSTGCVGVWSCASRRCLWSYRVHPVGEGVIQLHLISSLDHSRKRRLGCHSLPSSGCGDILVTQSRAGRVMMWCIDWKQLTFHPWREKALHDDNVYDEDCCTFTKMNVVETVSHVYVIYPVGDGGVCACCCYCGHNKTGLQNVRKYHSYDGDDQRATRIPTGMITALSGIGYGDGMVVFLGFEDGCVESWRVNGDDEHAVLAFRKYKCLENGSNPCISLDVGIFGDSYGGGVDIVVGYAGDAMGGEESMNIDGKHSPLIELGHIDIEKAEYTTRHRMFATKKQSAMLRGMDQVIFREDGKYLAAACWDGKVRIYRVSSGKLVDVILHHKDAATFVLFFDDKQTLHREQTRRRLAIGSRDGTVSLWSMK